MRDLSWEDALSSTLPGLAIADTQGWLVVLDPGGFDVDRDPDAWSHDGPWPD